MAVYARGYRPYEGVFGRTPPAWLIFREGIGMALRRKGVRWIFGLAGIALVVMCGIMYVQFVVNRQIDAVTGGIARIQIFEIHDTFEGFHHFTSLLAAVAAVLVGSGLVADDLRTRSLSLYLVRPIRPIEYAVGKALILPALLVPLALVPGLVLFLLLCLWQPPGDTWSFMQDHMAIAGRVLGFYAVAATSLTGLMLALSSRTPRRGAVIGMAAAVLFGGPFLRAIGTRLTGLLGDVLRSVDLVNNSMRAFIVRRERAETEFETFERLWQPSETAVIAVAAICVLAGLWLTWRRAHSVEVSE